MKNQNCSAVRVWNRAGNGHFIATVVLGLLIMTCENGFSQGKRVPRSTESRGRVEGFINDFINPLGSDDDLRSSDRRQTSVQGQTDVEALRPLIRGFADSMAQLTYAIHDQLSQTPGLRKIYGEALRLSNAAETINKRASKYDVDGAMLDDLQQLDADWRELAYRMDGISSLDRDTSGLLTKIKEIDQRIRQLIKIQPQFDRRQLTIKAAGLAADLDNLQEDVASELGQSPDSRYYRVSISRAHQIVLDLVSISRDGRVDNGQIINEYRQFESIWDPLVAKLRMEEDRYIERGLSRVAASLGEIQQLLLLPQSTDQSQFVYLAKSLKKDLDQFFERTPLVLVMRLPNAEQSLQVADRFYKATAKFIDVVNRGQDGNTIAEAFGLVDQAQRAFLGVYQDVESDRAIAVLRRIEQTIKSLRAAFQIHSDDFDNRSAVDLAAAIQNYTDQIALTCKRWFDQDNQPFATDCLREAVSLAELSAKLHDDIFDGKRQSDVRGDMEEVYQRCKRVYEYLEQCRTDDRATLVRLSTSLSPAINELRALILN